VKDDYLGDELATGPDDASEALSDEAERGATQLSKEKAAYGRRCGKRDTCRGQSAATFAERAVKWLDRLYQKPATPDEIQGAADAYHEIALELTGLASARRV
jgi:hypothetical protein